jgi:molybdate transport system permease protein
LSLPFGIFFPGCWCGAISRKALLDSILHLPLVLPPVVVGYLLLIAMGRRGFIGSWLYDWFGLSFAFSWRGAVLAAAVMSFPLMVRAIRLALEGVDIKLAGGAYPRGGPLAGVFHITLPLTLPGIIVGTVLAFARSLGSLARPSPLSPISRRNAHHSFGDVYPDSDPGGEGAAARLCLISIVLALVSLLISEWLARLSRSGWK